MKRSPLQLDTLLRGNTLPTYGGKPIPRVMPLWSVSWLDAKVYTAEADADIEVRTSGGEMLHIHAGDLRRALGIPEPKTAAGARR